MTRLLHISFILLLGLTACKGGKEVTSKKSPDDEYRTTFHEAIQEKMRGNCDISAGLFEKCLELNPTSDAAHYALSDLYESMGNPQKALEHAQSAYDLDNANKWYVLRLAYIYFNAGDYHKSASFFKQTIEDEKSLDIKLKYAEALIYSHQYEDAIKMLDEIEVETGKSAQLSLTKHDIYLELGDKEAAQKELEDLINDAPTNVENRLVIADYFLRTNQMEEAEKVVNDLIEMAPQSGEARLIIADIELRKGNIEKCFEHLRIGFEQEDVAVGRKLALIASLQRYAFEDNDDARIIQNGVGDLYTIVYDEELKNDTLHAQYGYFLQLQNKPLKAIEQFQFVVDINPNNFDSWIELLYAQYHADEYDGMLSNGKKAVDLFPAQPAVFLMAGIAAYETGDFESSEEWLYYGKGLVVKDVSLESEFQHQLGKLSWLQKDYGQAHTYFDDAKEIDPYNGNVYRSIALCFMDEGKETEAFEEVEKALDQAPINAFFLSLKAELYFITEKYEKAKKYVENALVYEPGNPDVVEIYGDVLFKLGEEEKAVKNWEQAKKLGGYSKVLLKKIGERKYYAE